MKWFLALVLAGCAATVQAASMCTPEWYRSVESKVKTSDGKGHGPDVGSEEWKSAVEFRLGLRGRSSVPARDSEEWCSYIDGALARRASAKGRSAANRKDATGPTFSCDKVVQGGIEELICGDTELAALDRQLAGVYAAASQRVVNEKPLVLQGEQRGWVKRRNDCGKSADKRVCVRDEYLRRIAELQARYRLVPVAGRAVYVCDGKPGGEVAATYFQTEPPTLIATRGDKTAVMFVQPSGSGAKYQGRNESLWEHQGEAQITWGAGAAPMRCKKKP